MYHIPTEFRTARMHGRNSCSDLYVLSVQRTFDSLHFLLQFVLVEDSGAMRDVVWCEHVVANGA